MNSNVLDLKTFSNQELCNELSRRLSVLRVAVCQTPPDLPPITPYAIMMKMIENGWKENPKTGESDERITKMWKYLGYLQYTDDESYCAATVNACLKLAGYETSESIPAARSFESYGKNLTLDSVGVQGDIAVFKRTDSTWKGHVGFVTSVTDTHIVLSGGNQNNKMCTKIYNFFGDKLSLIAFRRPAEMNRVTEPDYKTLKEWDLL